MAGGDGESNGKRSRALRLRLKTTWGLWTRIKENWSLLETLWFWTDLNAVLVVLVGSGGKDNKHQHHGDEELHTKGLNRKNVQFILQGKLCWTWPEVRAALTVVVPSPSRPRTLGLNITMKSFVSSFPWFHNQFPWWKTLDYQIWRQKSICKQFGSIRSAFQPLLRCPRIHQVEWLSWVDWLSWFDTFPVIIKLSFEYILMIFKKMIKIKPTKYTPKLKYHI